MTRRITLALILSLATGTAAAHSFYSYECCHDRDCRPLAVDEVRETPQGWLIVSSGRTIPYDFHRLKNSPDGRYHLCTTSGDADGMILCFYRPLPAF